MFKKPNPSRKIKYKCKFPTLLVFGLLLFYTYPSEAENSCLGAKFSSGEHKQLGDLGFKQSCESTNLISDCSKFTVTRKDNRRDFSYGDLVTLGDFFKNPIVAYEDTTPISRLDNAFRCIDKEGLIIQEQKTHPEVNYPNCTWVYIAQFKNFLKLASTNDNHFAWHNIKTYVKYHDLAINLALEGHAKQNSALLNHALFINGVADHYLSDAFASGHLRVPRKQISDWALKNLGGLLTRYIADAFAMILHDNEGKDRNGYDVGIAVQNSRGDKWITHSDSSLNICRQNSDDSIRLPSEAIHLSVTDILHAYKYGRTPEGVYPALFIVPTAIENNILSTYLNGDSFYKNQVLSDLRSHLPLPLRLILTKSKLKKFFRGLNDMQKHFANEVKSDVLAIPDLSLRIPQSYIQALSSTDK